MSRNIITIIVALAKQLEEAEKVTCKFIVRHHLLIWVEDMGNVNEYCRPSIVSTVFVILLCYSCYSVRIHSHKKRLAI